MTHRTLLLLGAVAIATASCGPSETEPGPPPAVARTVGQAVPVTDSTIDALLDAAGVAEPFAQATLSTKLMGTVTAVLVREGDRVAAGQPLVRIDARDVVARQSQVSATIAETEAVHRDAQAQAGRIRALYADSAAARVQLDAAETALARAEAAVRQARAGASELAAVAGYAVVRAPFAGIVTQRFIDAGAFATPGAPLLTLQDGRRLRVSVTVAPEAARAVRRGATLAAMVEQVAVRAVVEGVVPAPAGNVYTVNAIVDNPDGTLLPGSAATLSLPQGTRRAMLVPASALRREGDLTGVQVRASTGDELRWVRVGTTLGDRVEILGGLAAGELVVVPPGGDAPSLRTASAAASGGR